MRPIRTQWRLRPGAKKWSFFEQIVVRATDLNPNAYRFWFNWCNGLCANRIWCLRFDWPLDNAYNSFHVWYTVWRDRIWLMRFSYGWLRPQCWLSQKPASFVAKFDIFFMQHKYIAVAFTSVWCGWLECLPAYFRRNFWNWTKACLFCRFNFCRLPSNGMPTAWIGKFRLAWLDFCYGRS